MNKPLVREKITGFRNIEKQHRVSLHKLLNAVELCDEPAFVQAAKSLLCYYQDTLECGDTAERARRVFWIQGEWNKTPPDHIEEAIKRTLYTLLCNLVSTNAPELSTALVLRSSTAASKGRIPAPPLPGRIGGKQKAFLVSLLDRYAFNAKTRQIEEPGKNS